MGAGNIKKPATPVAKKDIGVYAGIASFVSGLAGIAVLPQLFVPLAVVLAFLAIGKRQAIWGIVGLIFALIGFLMSPVLMEATGMQRLLAGHSGPYRPYPQISQEDQDYEMRKEQAVSEMEDAVEECREQHEEGKFKTNLESAQCSNPKIIEAFRRANYRYMDLIESFTAKRAELAEKLDKEALTEDQVQEQVADVLDQLTAEAEKRDGARNK